MSLMDSFGLLDLSADSASLLATVSILDSIGAETKLTSQVHGWNQPVNSTPDVGFTFNNILIILCGIFLVLSTLLSFLWIRERKKRLS